MYSRIRFGFPSLSQTLALAVLWTATISGSVQGQTTAFTYQGQLKDGGSPAGGAHDMTFRLFDADVDGTQVGADVMQPGVTVTDGLFTVLVDFGSVFSGAPLWLEIEVDSQVLSPRQPLTSAPYAQTSSYAQSSNVANYAYGPWVPSGTDLYYVDGNIGIGTVAPAAPLDVAGTAKCDSLLMTPGAGAGLVMTSDASGYGSWQSATGLTLPYSGTTSVDGSYLFDLHNTGTGNGLSIQVDSTLASARAITGTISSTAPGAASAAVRGINNGTGNLGIGVYGSHSGSGYGVLGLSSFGYGVFGSSSTSFGVFGSGATGVYGSGADTGVYGYASTTGGNAYGVQGYGISTDGGGGVHGFAPSTTGTTKGVTGLNYSNQGIGVLGSAEASSGNTSGVWGQTYSPNGFGVTGYCSTGTANAGVHAISDAFNGNGIIAEATNGSSAYAVWAKAPQAVGVRCDGALQVSGTKSFRIDHPFDPENKYLMHYCSESPEPLNVYSGNATTDAAGYAQVTMPSYFEEINRDFRYQLTVLDEGDEFISAKVAKRIQQNTFVIRTSKPGVTVSWMVIGTRNDRYVRRYGAPVEMEKSAREKGTYLDPDLYGQPAEKAEGFHAPLSPISASAATPQQPSQKQPE